MIHIIHISDGEKHFSEATKEYSKRLGKNIEIHTIKPIKHTDVSFIKREETKKLIEKLEKIKGVVVLCDERGESMNTIKFSEKIQHCRNNGDNIIYIIGGSYGVDIELLEAHKKILLLNLSPLVMPHGLAFLVLIEQVYRALEIIKGSGYHHM